MKGIIETKTIRSVTVIYIRDCVVLTRIMEVGRKDRDDFFKCVGGGNKLGLGTHWTYSVWKEEPG